MSAFPEEFNNLKGGKELESGSSLITLTPFIDHQGVLRVGGRIQNAPAPPEVRHLIILQARARITELLIYSLQLEFAHSTKYVNSTGSKVDEKRGEESSTIVPNASDTTHRRSAL